jgi:putative ABC transport system substrate-binding protein
MKRRTFITGLGSAVAWPLAARAQQSAIPVIGFLNPTSSDTIGDRLRGFHRGLKESGYVEGENVAIEYRWADNQAARLPELVTDLVQRRVAVIATSGGPATAFAAKRATTMIPILFVTAEDPVRLGLVASLAWAGSNLTGVSFLATELVAKRLEHLRELVPGAARIAVLVNPAEAAITEPTLRDLEAAARVLGLAIQVLKASTSGEIDGAFAPFLRERPDALFVATGPFFTSRRAQLARLATLHKVPASYGTSDFIEVGGLISYGASLTDAYRQMGVYTGRILKGEKPANLPVMQPTKFELVINLKTAKALGLTIPETLLATADEVIP